MPEVKQPVTDDSIRVRQLSHYQFSWVAGEPGTYTLQLVLDQGAWEEVLTLSADDADVLQDLLRDTKVAHYDVGRRTLLFGVTAIYPRRHGVRPALSRESRSAAPAASQRTFRGSAATVPADPRVVVGSRRCYVCERHAARTLSRRWVCRTLLR